MQQLLGGIIALLSPVWPQHWWNSARGLASGIGWMTPMFLWAIFGVVFSLNLGFGRRHNSAGATQTTELSGLPIMI